MKKSKKIMLWVLPLLVIGCLMFTNVVFGMNLGESVGNTIDSASNTEGISTVTDLTYKVWNTVSVVAQVAAIIAIIFAGVRYMFASADQKADIKKQTIILVVGALLVFGAGLVVNLINGVVGNLQQQ